MPAGRVTDLISLGVLASYVSRDAVDEAIEETGRAAKRSDGTIPLHVVVYFTMALALFAEEDYEEVALRLAGVLADWGAGWEPTSGGLTKARKRLGPELMAELFSEVARPVVEEDTEGAFFGRWRVMSLDGMVFDVEASPKNVAAFGLPDHSYLSVVIDPAIRGKARTVLLDAAGDHKHLDQSKARYVRVVEYEVTGREGNGAHELFALITNIVDPREAPAIPLAGVYQQRWEHETGNKQLKTCLRGPGKVLRSRLPELVYQEIGGYLLTHSAFAALICQAATAAGIDPDRVRFKRTVRTARRRVGDPSFSP
ncbi:transposase [Candidatus Frankia alpina]|uniref:transposase n=1 Tax=Candidatus Frankia alpina TaxID=2699483 RepID=UPI001F23D77E|nr:transposase [Candidatus Frankia alpina]